MEKEFVPYEQSLELKELGFDEPCFGRYYYKESYPMLNPNSGETELVFEFGQYIKQTEITILVPTYQQAFRWFREKYKLSGTPHYFTNGFYCYTINDMKNSKKSNRLFTEFETYEEAELECLRRLIEIVKNATKE
jgi:hypothetical protein